MKLTDVRDWLKTLGTNAAGFYIGALDAKVENSIGVYQNKRDTKRVMALGGRENTKGLVRRVSILIHGSSNARETDALAQSLYDAIANACEQRIGDGYVSYFDLKDDEPIDVGPDSAGIYERVIDLNIHYHI